MSAALALNLDLLPNEVMSNSIKATLLSAYRDLMRPLVRILLRYGISFGEFAETLKAVYIEVAEKDFALPARKQSLSRIAIISGLTRKEVGRISDLLRRDSLPMTSNLNRVGRVLAGWHQDPDFTGPYGLPLELAFDLPPERSFTELVRRYSGDMPARAMLEELKRVHAVDELSNGQLRVLTRSYIPEQIDQASIEFMSSSLRDLAETLDHNLNKDAGARYFERRVWTPSGIQKNDFEGFGDLVTEKGQQFLETLDNWLGRRESDADRLDDKEKVKVGVGVYLFTDRDRKDS